VGGAIWASFLLALCLAALTAMSYAELVTKYPGAGGAPLYINKAFRNPFFTFMIAFTVLASGISSACVAARSFGGRYMDSLFGLSPSATRTLLIGALFVLAVALINFRGVSESVKVNIVLTLVELSGLVIIMLIGAALLASGEADLSRPFTFKEGANVPLAIVAGAAVAFYALIGFEDAVNMAEETQNPTRVFPRALLGGLALAGIIYLLVSFTASMAVDAGTLAANKTGPLLEVVERSPVAIPPRFFSLIALIAITNTALINMIMASRVIYGMANQGVIPSVLARTHATRRTPYIAIIFTTVIALLLVTNATVDILADTTVALLLIVFTLVNVAVLALRRDEAAPSRFRAPSFVPIVGAVTCILLLIRLLWDKDLSFYTVLGGLLATGLLLWVINVMVGGRRAEAIDASGLEAT
jgi:amino acid transporter